MPAKISSWVVHLNIEYCKVTNNEKLRLQNPSLIKLNAIAIGLYNADKYKRKECTDEKLLGRIRFLANRQLKYYKSNKFCFIERFFSSLYNLVVIGKFQSSAFLAKKISDKLLAEIKRKERMKIKEPATAPLQGPLPLVPQPQTLLKKSSLYMT